jgi:histidine kinase-like protein
MADDWPLQSFLELGALPGAVPSARLHTRQVVFEWGLSALERNAELIVSELVTGAVLSAQATAPGAPVRMWLLSDHAQVLVLVQDPDPQPPDGAAERGASGHALAVVVAFSDQWGWYAPPETGGKVVWALIGGSHLNGQ